MKRVESGCPRRKALAVIVLGLIVARLMYDLGKGISLDTWTGEQLTLLANGLNLVMLALLIGWIAWCRRPVESAQGNVPAGNETQRPYLRNHLSASLSHELRTPMTSIVGYTELLLDEQDVTPEQRREWLTMIHGGGQRLMELINDFLDMAKIEARAMTLRPRECDLRRLHGDIERFFRGAAGAKGLAFSVSVDNSVPELVRADEMRLRQILANLVGNAIKFTSQGWVRVFTTAHCTPTEVRLTIQVSDTGCGIDPALRPMLFEPFVQGEAASSLGGTGLGLSICRALAQLMDGDISVESEPGKGSTFCVEVKVQPANMAPGRLEQHACAID